MRFRLDHFTHQIMRDNNFRENEPKYLTSSPGDLKSSACMKEFGGATTATSSLCGLIRIFHGPRVILRHQNPLEIDNTAP